MHDLVPFEGTPVRVGYEKDRAGGGLGEPRCAPADQSRHLGPGLDEEQIDGASQRRGFDEGTGVRNGRRNTCQKTVLMECGVGSSQKVDPDSWHATVNPGE
jgi:hypothetical protein